MGYKIVVTQPAQLDIEEAVAFIIESSPKAATKWLRGLIEKINSLHEQPARFAVMPETAALRMRFRSFPYSSHQIIYRIDEDQGIIFITRVYHHARIPLDFE